MVSLSSILIQVQSVGEPIVLWEKEMDAHIKINDSGVITKTDGVTKVHGIMSCLIVAPKDAWIPYLSARIQIKNCDNETLMYGLCAKCCSEQSREVPCLHSPDERAFLVHACIAELNFCVEYFNYTIIKMFDCMLYPKADKVFHKMMDSLQTLKLLSNNKELLKLMKMGCVSAFGKLMQRPKCDDYDLCTSNEELQDIIDRKIKDLEDIFLIDEDNVQVYSKLPIDNGVKKFNQLILGSHVTAFARMGLWMKILEFAHLRSFKVVQINTDSIVFVIDQTDIESLSIDMDPHFGSWKNQFENADITAFYALDPQTYHVEYRDVETGEFKSVSKVSGLQINETNAKYAMDAKSFSSAIDAAIQERNNPVEMEQVQTFVDPMSYKIYSKSIKYSLRSHLCKRRLLVSGAYYTAPYGMSQKMLSEMSDRHSTVYTA